MGKHLPCKQKDVGSNPIWYTNKSGRSSVCAERPAWDRKAGSSNLSTPTTYRQVNPYGAGGGCNPLVPDSVSSILTLPTI